MKLITDLFENTIDITNTDIDEYIKNVDKIPKELKAILITLQKYKIFSRDVVEDIKNISSSKIKSISQKYKISEEELKSLSSALKNIKLLINALPMYMDEHDRNSLISGKKTIDDVTLDLISNKGRALIVKQYTPLINKIVNQYLGKSPLDRAELLSAAMIGLTKAMNEYRKTDDSIDANDELSNKDEIKKNKQLSFQQYAGWRIRNQILNDINDYSRNIRIPQHATEKGISYKTIRFDNKPGDASTDAAIDRLINMSETPEEFEFEEHKMDKIWANVFKEIESKFGVKQSNIFFRNFGINGFEQEKMTTIAKQNNISIAYVSTIIKKIIQWCTEDKKTRLFLNELMDAISESILTSNIDKTKNEIYESFTENDVFIFIDSLTKYNNKYLYESTLTEVLSRYSQEACENIINTLKNGVPIIYEKYNINEELYKDFLECMYPTVNVKTEQELYILNEMTYLSAMFNKFDINI